MLPFVQAIQETRPDHMAPSGISVTEPVVDDARGPAYVGADLAGWHASAVPGWWSPSTKHNNNIGWRRLQKAPAPTKSIAPSVPVRSPWLFCVSDHRRPPFHCPKRGYRVGLLSRPVEAHRCTGAGTSPVHSSIFPPWRRLPWSNADDSFCAARLHFVCSRPPPPRSQQGPAKPSPSIYLPVAPALPPFIAPSLLHRLLLQSLLWTPVTV